jgi:glucose-1-phosphate cytidylyltransferase
MTTAHIDDIPVVILCGGQGTRLREETEYRPKPMVEIGPQPILWHIMKTYGAHGMRRFVLCLGYRGWVIKQYFLRYAEMHRDFTIAMGGDATPLFHNEPWHEDWLVTCAETGEETGTGGRIAKVAQYVDATPSA